MVYFAWEWMAGALETMSPEGSLLRASQPQDRQGEPLDGLSCENMSSGIEISVEIDISKALLLTDSLSACATKEPTSPGCGLSRVKTVADIDGGYKAVTSLLESFKDMSVAEKLIVQYLEESAVGAGKEKSRAAEHGQPGWECAEPEEEEVEVAKDLLWGGLARPDLSSLWRGLGARAAQALGLLDEDIAAAQVKRPEAAEDVARTCDEGEQPAREEKKCEPAAEQASLVAEERRHMEVASSEEPVGLEALVWQTNKEAEELERTDIRKHQMMPHASRTCPPPGSPLVASAKPGRLCSDRCSGGGGRPAIAVGATSTFPQPSQQQQQQHEPPTLIPPAAAGLGGRKTLVLDLDETLVHSVFSPVPNWDYNLTVHLEPHGALDVYVLKRPGVDEFLRAMAQRFEIVVFTASLQRYADPLLDLLDPEGLVAHRLFRDSCSWYRGGFVKDLSRLGRDLADTIIVDNSPTAFALQPENGVAVASFYEDERDRELAALTPFLESLADVTGDVRKHIANRNSSFWQWGGGSRV